MTGRLLGHMCNWTRVPLDIWLLRLRGEQKWMD